MAKELNSIPPVDIIIPFYKNADLVAPLFESLQAIASELTGSSCSVYAINDSPDDPKLEVALSGAVERLSRLVSCSLVRNPQNKGFVRSVNSVAEASVKAKHDVLLLNSDTVVFPGAIAEIRRVAYLDPMTGFVSPRSNNATICSLPHQAEFRNLSPRDAYASFLDISKYLPEYHFVPTAVGFCLYIKVEVLREFGILDEAYSLGYNEENDLIMRANRGGFRAVLANHAFVYHIGESSFSASDSPKQLLEVKNAELLNKRYPEYTPSVMNYFGSTHYEAERMLTALLPDSEGRLDIVFDFSAVGAYHNGTFEAAKKILKCASGAWQKYFNIHLMISSEAQRFHKLDRLDRVFFVPPETSRVFAIAFRFGQPFSFQHLAQMSRVGVLNVYAMLDTIAFDCQYLNHAGLPAIWSAVFEHADGAIYISDFVRDQFQRRFAMRPGFGELVAYLSLDLRDYAPEDPPVPGSGDYILVIGNAFAHKLVPETVDALAKAFPREKIVALGLNNDARHNVIAYTSGNLADATMRNLLRNAKFVVYPSLYEGFGIPVLESLANMKPVLARSIPVMRDIRQRIHGEDNLILYTSTEELTGCLQQGFPKWKVGREAWTGAGASGNWASVTSGIGDFLRNLLDGWSFRNSLQSRLEFMRLLETSGALSGTKPELDVVPAAADQPMTGGADRAAATRAAVELEAAVRDRDARISDIHNSLSWKVTAPLRKLGGGYLRMIGRS